MTLLLSFAASNAFSGPALSDSSAHSEKKGEAALAESWFDKGVEQHKSHDLTGAIGSFMQAIYFSRNGYNPESYFWLGKSFMDARENGKAIDAFNKYCEQNSGSSSNAHFYLGQIYLRENRLIDAEREAKTLREKDNENGEKAHNLRGEILMAKGDYESAQSEFQLALGTPPWNYADAWLNYAETYVKQQNWPLAVQEYSAILKAKGRLRDLDEKKCRANIAFCEYARRNGRDVINTRSTQRNILPAQLLPGE